MGVSVVGMLVVVVGVDYGGDDGDGGGEYAGSGSLG